MYINDWLLWVHYHILAFLHVCMLIIWMNLNLIVLTYYNIVYMYWWVSCFNLIIICFCVDIYIYDLNCCDKLSSEQTCMYIDSTLLCSQTGDGYLCCLVQFTTICACPPASKFLLCTHVKFKISHVIYNTILYFTIVTLISLLL